MDQSINIMVTDGTPPLAQLMDAGVARMSYGAAPYHAAIASLEAFAARAFSQAELTERAGKLAGKSDLVSDAGGPSQRVIRNAR